MGPRSEAAAARESGLFRLREVQDLSSHGWHFRLCRNVDVLHLGHFAHTSDMATKFLFYLSVNHCLMNVLGIMLQGEKYFEISPWPKIQHELQRMYVSFLLVPLEK